MGCSLVTLPPDYSEMGSLRTNKCISTDQPQEKGLDKCLINASVQGNSQNASRDESQPVRAQADHPLKAESPSEGWVCREWDCIS